MAIQSHFSALFPDTAQVHFGLAREFPFINLVCSNDPNLIDFLDRNVLSIPINGIGGFGHAVLMAVAFKNYPALLLMKEKYPAKFLLIAPNGPYGLSQALLTALGRSNDYPHDFRYLSLLLEHPSIGSIEDLVATLMIVRSESGALVDLVQIHGVSPLSPWLASFLITMLNGAEDAHEILLQMLNSPLMRLLPQTGPGSYSNVIELAREKGFFIVESSFLDSLH